MINKIIIIGASGHGKVVAEIALLSGYSISFWDDDIFKKLEEYEVSQRKLEVPQNSNLIMLN